MLNLMKYELIKQRTSKIILAGFLILAEAAFLIGVTMENDDIWVTGMAFLMLLAMITFFVVALEAIFTYYHDLRDKSGYMLFMTPHSVYTIMGSKIVTGILSIVIASAVFALLTFVDVTYAASHYGELASLANQIKEVLHQLYAIDINWASLLLGLIDVVFGWIAMVASGFLAITLVFTLISGMRAKGLISFIGFCIINWAYSSVVEQISSWLNLSERVTSSADLANMSGISATLTMSMPETALSCVMTIIFAGACFLFSGYLLNKELSL